MDKVRGTKPEELHYNYYETAKYEEDIVRAIPGYLKMHERIKTIIAEKTVKAPLQVLELGIGTGLTAEIIINHFEILKYVGIDFSSKMLDGARRRLARHNIELICDDYAKVEFPTSNDLVVSVISIHHQPTEEAKQALFKKVYNCLKPGGWFIFGDLFTWKQEKTAALKEACHLHYLVENAKDEKTLEEWAHHHKYMNHLAPLESQIEWLKEAGFGEVKVAFEKFNTALVVAKKNF